MKERGTGVIAELYANEGAILADKPHIFGFSVSFTHLEMEVALPHIASPMDLTEYHQVGDHVNFVAYRQKVPREFRNDNSTQFVWTTSDIVCMKASTEEKLAVYKGQVHEIADNKGIIWLKEFGYIYFDRRAFQAPPNEPTDQSMQDLLKRLGDEVVCKIVRDHNLTAQQVFGKFHCLYKAVSVRLADPQLYHVPEMVVAYSSTLERDKRIIDEQNCLPTYDIPPEIFEQCRIPESELQLPPEPPPVVEEDVVEWDSGRAGRTRSSEKKARARQLAMNGGIQQQLKAYCGVGMEEDDPNSWVSGGSFAEDAVVSKSAGVVPKLWAVRKAFEGRRPILVEDKMEVLSNDGGYSKWGGEAESVAISVGLPEANHHGRVTMVLPSSVLPERKCTNAARQREGAQKDTEQVVLGQIGRVMACIMRICDVDQIKELKRECPEFVEYALRQAKSSTP